MNHKPMLAVDCGGIEKVSFPVIASPKLDGVRAIISVGRVLSRSLKPIRNRRVQDLLKNLPVGLDGELIAGDPCAPDACRKTVSMVMSDAADISGINYHVFDTQTMDAGFERRLMLLRSLVGLPGFVIIVPQVRVGTADLLSDLEIKWTQQGFEGVILRKPDGPYKHGRSTLREGYLLKLKRFTDSEGEVVGTVELMHNSNEAKTDALGHTVRSSHKAGMVPMGVLGALVVRDLKTGVQFEVGSGFTAAERASLWSERFKLAGRFAKYKYFSFGVKDKPRSPIFIGWRDASDM